VQEKVAGKAIHDVFSCQLLFHGKEEFAGNPLQNGGNRRGNLYSHQTKPVAVTALGAATWDARIDIKGKRLEKQGL